MQFIETASYQRPFASNDSSSLTIPPSWQQYRHPNGDIYYYNPLLRLITPEDIRDPAMLEFVLDAREDHIQCLQDDSSISNLPDDWELTLSDVTDSSAVIGMHSRKMGLSYEWAEDKGLEIMNPEHFWSHVAEYPSHHEDLPPNTEAAFIKALTDAKMSLDNGSTLPFTTSQIDQMIQRYQVLKALQAEGKAVVPALAWLMGVVMPLEAYEGAYTDETLQELMERLRF